MTSDRALKKKLAAAETPVPSQRLAQREDTRRRLLTAARKLFRARGVEHVSIADIAAAADVSRATIYLYFSGKPPILEALLEEDWAGQLKLFDRLLEMDVRDTGQLSVWVLRVAEGMRRARDSFGIHWAALGQNPALTGRHHEHRTVLARVLLRAFPNGEEPNLSRAVEAELIVAELEHFATSAAVGWGADEIAAALPLVVGRLRGLGLPLELKRALLG
jgi:AcrR family transcriptional regulator